jgi:drug/metabolite transporter (DMT)-like permease
MFAMTLIRYAVVALLLALMLVRLEGASAFRFAGHGPRLFLLGSAGFAGFGLLAFTALSYTSSTNVSLIMAMMPAISAVLAAASARRLPPLYTVTAIAIAFAGVSLVLTGGDYTHLISAGDALGELLALLGAICWVVYTRGAAAVPSWSTLRYTTITTVLGVPSIAAATVVATAVGYVDSPNLGAVLAGWPELSYLIVLAGVVAVLCWNAGNKALGPINGTLFMNLVPITTFSIIGIANLEMPSPAAASGVVLVIVGLLVNNYCMRRSARPAQTVAPPSQEAELAVQAGDRAATR